MGVANRPLLLGLALVMVLGTAVYFRLWVIDYKISAVDAELLRREFDLANKEAVDESAEWRYRFDEERERANKCMKELTELKETTGKKAKDTTGSHEKFQMLQKENKYLVERLASLKQQLEIERLRCSKSQ